MEGLEWKDGRMEGWKDGRPPTLPLFQPPTLPLFHSLSRLFHLPAEDVVNRHTGS